MRTSILVVMIVLTSIITSAQTYWQQQTNYKIDVSLDDKRHTLKGFLSIEYINNSPDTLEFIWFHLWPNAYKNKETAYAKQILKDAEGKKRWREMKDNGYIDSLDFKVDGKKATLQMDEENIDVAKLILPDLLIPGTKMLITTPFFVKIPTYSSRSGHIGNSYMICQWYPKPAVYDRKGWHPMPYLDQGEFYSEFGTFTVNLTVPAAYVIGATGTMKNEEERALYQDIGKKNQEGTLTKYRALPPTAKKTLSFTADNVHDFAWFADKDFIIRYDTALLDNGKVIDVYTYSFEKGNPNWKSSIRYVEDAVRSYSRWVGTYPYQVAQAVEGPANLMSGGMEYPTITLITSPRADEPELDGVIAHEVGHNWFYGILASNERDHPWMDEGINTYYQFRYEAEKHRSNSFMGSYLPDQLKTVSPEELLATIYTTISTVPIDHAIETPSSGFSNEEDYAMTAYIKAATWMYVVEVSIGKEKLEKVMRSYFEKWKFKHPYPEDLKAEFELITGMGFDEIFGLLQKKGSL